MPALMFIPSLFLGIALVFLALGLKEVVREKGVTSIAGKLWLKMALVFVIVGISLYSFLSSISDQG